MHDLFEQQITMGQLLEAAKLYGRGIREYCTSPKHVIEVSLNCFIMRLTVCLIFWVLVIVRCCTLLYGVDNRSL